jgi:glycosyltransferase involved in cell wall biosynthesis
MKLMMDASSLQGGISKRGIGRYSFMLAQGLLNHPDVKELVLVYDRNLQEGFIENWARINSSNKVKTYFLDSNDYDQANNFLTDLDKIKNFDLIIFPNPLEGERRLFMPRYLHPNEKYFFLIHDLIPYKNQSEYFLTIELKVAYFEDLEFCLTHNLLTNSQFTSLQVKQEFPNAKIIEVLGGPYEICKTSKSIEELRGYIDYFLISISGDHPRKNAEGLIKAWSRIPQTHRRNHPLVIVAGGSESRVRTLLRFSSLFELEINREIFIYSEVSEPVINWLYANCYLNIMPSFEEGLGMPVLEALARGKPSLGSNRTSLPEILVSKQSQFDPFDVNSIRECIAKVLDSPKLYTCILDSQLNLANKYSWKNVVERVVNATKEGKVS